MSKRRPPAARSREVTVGINPTFKLVFLVVAGLTVMFFLAACVLSTGFAPSGNVDRLVQVSITLTTAGAGACFGLVGGKALP